LADLIGSLTPEELIEVVTNAAERHHDIARAVRLVAARSQHDPSALQKEVDRALRTRRCLEYWESIEWAEAAQPVVAELELLAQTAPSLQLIRLLQRAVGHVVRVLEHADDSSGAIGYLARELLELHAIACDSGASDPIELADWMACFTFSAQYYFELDPVRYAGALREGGLAAYREAVMNASEPDSFAVRYVRQRLAIRDEDLEAIVDLAGGDLSNAYQFASVAEAMAEIGRDDLVLEWAERGIAETSGWQVARLYDIACETHARRGEPLAVLRLCRAHHERAPTSSTYEALHLAASALDVWDVERDAARAALQLRDPRAYVRVLLADGDAQLAWDVATASSRENLLEDDDWLRLAEAHEAIRPDEALAVYQRVVDETLRRADVRAYRRAAKILKRARAAALAATQSDLFDDHVRRLREQYRRRPSLIGILDRAGFV
jgi:rubrerythrin